MAFNAWLRGKSAGMSGVWVFGFAAGVLCGVLWSQHGSAVAEDITLNTYYPSPRGVYEELRAGRYMGLNEKDSTTLDTVKGELVINQIAFRDKKSGRRMGLRFEDSKMIVSELDWPDSPEFAIFDFSQNDTAAKKKKR